MSLPEGTALAQSRLYAKSTTTERHYLLHEREAKAGSLTALPPSDLGLHVRREQSILSQNVLWKPNTGIMDFHSDHRTTEIGRRQHVPFLGQSTAVHESVVTQTLLYISVGKSDAYSL